MSCLFNIKIKNKLVKTNSVLFYPSRRTAGAKARQAGGA